MFGHNAIVGQSFFREAPEAQAGKLLVTSIFQTLQGEGPFAGQPCVFVRLSLCNLACSFCDTFFDKGDWMSRDEIMERVRGACTAGPVPDLLVVTGGEPSLQRLEALWGILPRMQVESNGIIPVTPLLEGATIVVSPKCIEKDGAPLRYIKPPAASLARAACLKFVMSGDPESLYYSVPEWALEWKETTGRPVFVSPMAEYNHLPEDTRALYEARRDPTIAEREKAERVSFWEPGLIDMEKGRRNYEYAAVYAVRQGLRLSVQMHLFASLP